MEQTKILEMKADKYKQGYQAYIIVVIPVIP